MSSYESNFVTVAITGIDTPVLACTRCGALVWYDLKDRHVAFHARTAEAEPSYA